MTEKEKIGHLVRFGLALKKIPLTEISKWADYQIENGKNDNLYFDLSFAKSTNEVIEFLTKDIEWNFKSAEIRELILGYYNEYLKSDNSNWKKIQKELIDFYNYIEYEDSNERVEDFIYYLIDDYHLRNDGFGGSLKMPDFLTEKLSEFDTYQELQKLLKRNKINGFEIKKRHANNV
ncbi:hypothetical protein VOI54_12515 [Tamlana sp. 2201CG12-4]|uniref:hypothetical protein n=1 Tax=Tamlana sp. 2201CG12-4 TaxID=3112582 RepID=UPI002DB97B4E|nr:hypothetical protein [Tamlana sp. 2201CG12-4]MEC3907844.1 hypothetical protein [Tamlana sp. 2201CG12-4]